MYIIGDCSYLLCLAHVPFPFGRPVTELTSDDAECALLNGRLTDTDLGFTWRHARCECSILAEHPLPTYSCNPSYDTHYPPTHVIPARTPTSSSVFLLRGASVGHLQAQPHSHPSNVPACSVFAPSSYRPRRSWPLRTPRPHTRGTAPACP
jgi:hypothetical protein